MSLRPDLPRRDRRNVRAELPPEIEDYRLDARTRVWQRPDMPGLSYSDGNDLEQRLLEQLRAASDLSTLSDELRALIVDWPSEVHLSSSRANLLRPFLFAPGMRVLEAGAGCGAMTRYLGETGAWVDAIEGALPRAACAAERCRDLGRVRVICDELTRFQGQDRYDVVTLIGVLEYARLFVQGDDPVQSVLARVRELLSGGGVLLLAIENQLGLKYFNGCREDHLGVPYAGVTDLYTASSPVTFVRTELADRLRAAGFRRIDWYYPFPDYKLPSTIIAGRALEQPDFAAAEMLLGEYARDYAGGARRNFDESAVWRVLARNRTLGDFANSFLVVACVGERNALDAESAWLAHRYSTFRTPHFCVGTCFRRTPVGSIEVEKSRLDSASLGAPASGSPRIRQRLGVAPYVRGRTFAQAFSDAVARGLDADGLAGALTPWIGYLVERAQPAPATSMATPWSKLTLPGDLVDCTPFNLIVSESGELNAIDLELEVEGRIPLPWVALRGVVHTATRCFGHRYLADRTGWAVVREILPRLGFGDIEDWTPYLAMEDALIRAVLRPWPGRREEGMFDERLGLAAGTMSSINDALSKAESEAAVLRTWADSVYRVLDAVAGTSSAATEPAEASRHAVAAIDALESAAIDGPRTQRLVRTLRSLADRVRRGDEAWVQVDDARKQRSSVEIGMAALREAFADQEARMLRAQAERDLRERELQQTLDAARIDAAARAESAATRIAELEATLQAERTNKREIELGLSHAGEIRARLEQRVADRDDEIRRYAERVRYLEKLADRTLWDFLRWKPADGNAGAANSEPARRSRHALRDRSFGLLRAAYKRLPLNERTRQRAKGLFYRGAGSLFAYRENYQLWKAAEEGTSVSLATRAHHPAGSPVSTEPTRPEARPMERSVSIVIPAYGKSAMTRRCIETLMRAGAAPVEIIVVDDASPEPLEPGLRDLKDVQVVRNDANRGFVDACNRGAQIATGSLLLFLNNDTEVAPGAIEAMAATFEGRPDIGLVGCKLVFPDGRLQEAGCGMRPDGTAEMVGLWDDPKRPCYNFERDVSYCSAACFMIDRMLFNELGGFDPAFAPAYCEDSDLCFRVRAAGKRVVYQPRATVVHALSASMQDSPIDKKAVIAVNQARFLDRWSSTLAREDAVRAIALYLPQYHPIPENDRWWGEGFTEWTNVARARPAFEGHVQPNAPGALGYYDLREPAVRREQARLARDAGLAGFCYYYYWFAGTRLLHAPLDAVIASGEPDFPFCVCWANENWTRRWDGLESEILIAQQHSPDDDIAFLDSVLPALRDPRYLRVRGKPLLLVYRPSLLPDAAATTRRWRAHAERAGLPGLYLVSVQSFFHVDSRGPDAFGFDAAAEFPPHSFAIECEPQPRGPADRPFEGRAYDYARTAANFMSRELPPYKLFRGVMPRWDNTPRRGSQANVFVGADVEGYRDWLQHAVDHARRFYQGDERLVFINAWNEWGEGNYLEPDARLGHAYLDATRSVLVADESRPSPRATEIQ